MHCRDGENFPPEASEPRETSLLGHIQQKKTEFIKLLKVIFVQKI